MGTVAVVGAAGIIGPAIVATLAEHESVERILVLDINEAGRGRLPSGTAAAGRRPARSTSATVARRSPRWTAPTSC